VLRPEVAFAVRSGSGILESAAEILDAAPLHGNGRNGTEN
jgi:hypothetical protein